MREYAVGRILCRNVRGNGCAGHFNGHYGCQNVLLGRFRVVMSAEGKGKEGMESGNTLVPAFHLRIVGGLLGFLTRLP
jgi:hypothetical protein